MMKYFCVPCNRIIFHKNAKYVWLADVCAQYMNHLYRHALAEHYLALRPVFLHFFAQFHCVNCVWKSSNLQKLWMIINCELQKRNKRHSLGLTYCNDIWPSSPVVYSTFSKRSVDITNECLNNHKINPITKIKLNLSKKKGRTWDFW